MTLVANFKVKCESEAQLHSFALVVKFSIIVNCYDGYVRRNDCAIHLSVHLDLGTICLFGCCSRRGPVEINTQYTLLMSFQIQVHIQKKQIYYTSRVQKNVQVQRWTNMDCFFYIFECFIVATFPGRLRYRVSFFTYDDLNSKICARYKLPLIISIYFLIVARFIEMSHWTENIKFFLDLSWQCRFAQILESNYVNMCYGKLFNWLWNSWFNLVLYNVWKRQISSCNTHVLPKLFPSISELSACYRRNVHTKRGLGASHMEVLHATRVQFPFVESESWRTFDQLRNPRGLGKSLLLP